jgi:hypothetical protein
MYILYLGNYGTFQTFAWNRSLPAKCNECVWMIPGT